jgi:protein-disulfide isomerase
MVWTKRYVATVVFVTISTLVIGFFLWNSEERQILDATFSGGWSRGADSALVVIDAYVDFECSSCVEKEDLTLQAVATYLDEVKLVHHHYPSSDFSHKIAEALEAAGEQGKFWEMHDRTVGDVPDDLSELKAAAKDLGLDMGKFDEALDSGRFTKKVQLAVQEARSDGVHYVALFINGREYEKYPGTLADLYDAIDEEVERIKANEGN